MKIRLIGCGKIGSDCTGPYRVEMSGPCTVKEFVEFVLKQFPKEWGYIGIAKKGEIFGDPNIEYAKGKIITENRLEGVESKIVLNAGAHGGWSRMDYRLDIGEGVTLYESAKEVRAAASELFDVFAESLRIPKIVSWLDKVLRRFLNG